MERGEMGSCKEMGVPTNNTPPSLGFPSSTWLCPLGPGLMPASPGAWRACWQSLLGPGSRPVTHFRTVLAE